MMAFQPEATESMLLEFHTCGDCFGWSYLRKPAVPYHCMFGRQHLLVMSGSQWRGSFYRQMALSPPLGPERSSVLYYTVL